MNKFCYNYNFDNIKIKKSYISIIQDLLKEFNLIQGRVIVWEEVLVIIVIQIEIQKILYLIHINESMQKAVKSEINGFIESILKNVNKRDINTINTHLNTIKKALEKDIEGSIDLYFGGSVKKYTYVNGLSDIDMLVKLNDTSLQNKTPKEVLKYFESRLRERLPNTNITVGTLAVTVKFSSGNEIQILPSIKQGSGYKIATADGSKWSNLVKPDKFTEKLTSVNKSNGNRVIPNYKNIKNYK